MKTSHPPLKGAQRKTSNKRRKKAPRKGGWGAFRRFPAWLLWLGGILIAAAYIYFFYYTFVSPFSFRWRAIYGTPTYPEGYDVRGIDISHYQGRINWEKLRNASTEIMYTIGTLYNMVNKTDLFLMERPIIDGYVSLKSFEEAARGGTIADVPYMIGYTLNDLGAMGPGIAEFCKVRQDQGSKTWAYEFARPLPDDGKHPEITDRLKGAFHSSDLWYVFKSLKHCWRPWTQGDWDLSEKMLTAWTNFVKCGNPNGEGEGLGWKPCTAASPQFMLFKLDGNNKEASEMGAPILPK